MPSARQVSNQATIPCPVPGRWTEKSERAPGIRILDRGVVQSGPEQGLRQQLLRCESLFPYIVDGRPARRTQVLSQNISLPAIHDSAVLFGRLDDGHPHRVPLGNQSPTGGQKTAPSIGNGRQMLLKERERAAQIGDDDVGLDGKGDARGEILDEFDAVSATIGGGDFAGDLNDRVRFDGVDAAAPNWQASTAKAPGPVPISSTTEPGRTALRRACA